MKRRFAPRRPTIHIYDSLLQNLLHGAAMTRGSLQMQLGKAHRMKRTETEVRMAGGDASEKSAKLCVCGRRMKRIEVSGDISLRGQVT